MKKLEVFKEDLERSILRFATFWSLRLDSRISPGGVVPPFSEGERSESDAQRDETDKKTQKNKLIGYIIFATDFIRTTDYT